MARRDHTRVIGGVGLCDLLQPCCSRPGPLRAVWVVPEALMRDKLWNVFDWAWIAMMLYLAFHGPVDRPFAYAVLVLVVVWITVKVVRLVRKRKGARL